MKIVNWQRALGVLPYVGYIGIYGPKGQGFLPVLVRNRVSILALLVSNKAWCLGSSPWWNGRSHL